MEGFLQCEFELGLQWFSFDRSDWWDEVVKVVLDMIENGAFSVGWSDLHHGIRFMVGEAASVEC